MSSVNKKGRGENININKKKEDETEKESYGGQEHEGGMAGGE